MSGSCRWHRFRCRPRAPYVVHTCSSPYCRSSSRKGSSLIMRRLARLRWKVMTRGTDGRGAGGGRPVGGQEHAWWTRDLRCAGSL